MARIIESTLRQNFFRFNEISFAQYSIRTAVNLSFKVIDNGTVEPDSPPLLILHDLLSNKRQWNSIGKTIQTITKRPVVIVDQRNHGHSPHTNSHKYEESAEDVLQLLSKLSVEKAYFLGHGIGGKASMLTALLAPQKVAGLVVIDASPISSWKQFNEFYAKVIISMKHVSFKKHKKLDKAKENAEKVLIKVINDDDIMNIVLSNIILKPDHTIGWACNIESLMKNFKYIISFPRNVKGKKYYGPTLFIGGQLSEYLPPDDLPMIRDLFPRAVITYISQTGHNLQIDDPKSLLELIIRFLNYT